MTDQEFYGKLKILEPSMNSFIANKGNISLTATEVGIMKELYPTLKSMSNGLPRVFKSSCPSCVREVFSIYISVWFRYKAL